MLEAYLSQSELSYFKLGEALKGLKDENVWKRPAEGILSVGEIAAHIAYWATCRPEKVRPYTGFAVAQWALSRLWINRR